MTTQKLNRIGYVTAGVTFVIASYIMFAHYHGFRGDYESQGIRFVLVAFIFNLIVLAYIVVVAKKNKIEGPLRSIIWMFANIPVAFVYLGFGLFLTGYYRVTIVNDTRLAVSNIRLTGCANKSIEKLAPGESETVWIELDSDCSLNITFVDHQKKKRGDTVAGYLCSGMGQKDEYYISGEDNPRY